MNYGDTIQEQAGKALRVSVVIGEGISWIAQIIVKTENGCQIAFSSESVLQFIWFDNLRDKFWLD